jgi:hypothetical protein
MHKVGRKPEFRNGGPTRPFHSLPLWLAEDLAIPLDLEASYEQTCRDLRIA